MMTEKGLGLQAKCVVAMVETSLGAGSILDRMLLRSNLKLHITKFIYDAKSDRYARVPNEEATVTVYPDQYLGCFSEDGRIEKFSAKIKEIRTSSDFPPMSSDFFPMLKVGNRVCICFDSLTKVGCIRSISCKSAEIQYAMSGYFKGYGFDGDPVEPMSSVDLQEMIKQIESVSEAEESEELGGKKPESAKLLQPDKEPEEHEESPEEEGIQPEEVSGADAVPESGMLSQYEIEQLLAGADDDEPNSEGSNSGGSEEGSEGTGDGKTEPEAEPAGGKRRFGSRS